MNVSQPITKISLTALQRLFPFLGWPRPDAALLKSDFVAGLTITLMVIPQGVAYAALAGMPLVTGIYAALLPALVAALWSSSSRLSVGPTALTALLVGSSLSGLAAPGGADWVQLAVWLALLSGALQLVLGFGKFGWLLNLMTSPVLTGFTQAAAILIMLSQLPALIGLQGPLPTLLQGASINPPAAAFGIASLVTLLLAKRLLAKRLPNFPTIIVVVVGSAAVSAWIGASASGTPVVGQLPSGLPSFYWPGWLPWSTLSALLLPAMVITLVSYLETASSAKAEHQKAGTRWDENQDLIGQGLAKFTAALCGTFPTSTSFSRAAIILHAGAKSGWATVATCFFIALALLWLMPLLHDVPKSVLAAVVIAAVGGLLKPRSIVQFWHVSKAEAVTCGVTFLLTLATAPRLHWGVLAGLLMSLSHFLHHRLHPRIIEVGLHPDGSLRDRHLWHLPPLAPHLYALRMDAELDFASSSGFGLAIAQHLGAHPDTRHVCLFAQPINRVDVTGVEAFAQLREDLAKKGVTLHISGIKLPVEQILQRTNLLDDSPLLKMYRTDAEALAALAKM